MFQFIFSLWCGCRWSQFQFESSILVFSLRCWHKLFHHVLPMCDQSSVVAVNGVFNLIYGNYFSSILWILFLILWILNKLVVWGFYFIKLSFRSFVGEAVGFMFIRNCGVLSAFNSVIRPRLGNFYLKQFVIGYGTILWIEVWILFLFRAGPANETSALSPHLNWASMTNSQNLTWEGKTNEEEKWGLRASALRT